MSEESIETRIEQLEATIGQIAQALAAISKGVNRVIEWEEKVSPNGIQLAGSTSIKRRGILMSMNTHILSNNSITVISLAINELGQVVVIPGPFQLVE